MLNKIRTVINPNVPGEQPPEGTPRPMSEYLSRMFRYCSQSLRRIFEWIRDHVAITDPLMEEDPHPQYAHIFNDSAYGHAILDQLSTPVLVSAGGTIKPFDSLYIPSKKIGIDTVNGQFTFEPDDSGIYLLNLNGYFGAQGAKSTIIVKVYANGAPTNLQFVVNTQTAIDTNFTSWGGIIQIGNNGGTAEFVVESTDPPGGVLEVYYLNVSITKQWPLLNGVPI